MTCRHSGATYQVMQNQLNPQGARGRIVRSSDPLNLEMPFGSLDSFTTPTDSFYVRCHFPIPQIAVGDWRLKVEGEVEKPLELNYDELLEMDTRTADATLECAGNSREFLQPKVKGVAWELGAVGNGSWTGVPLAIVLERAGIKAGATEVIFEGADNGEPKEAPRPAGPIHFARSIPLKKALDDVLLVYQMNGEQLLQAHGFPLRAIVPGWYAVASVKWLQRIIVTNRPFNGYYQTIDYAYWDRQGELPELVPITEMQVKAEIARPENGEIVAANSSVRIHGAAWSGEAQITQVEISFDPGGSWNTARLLGKPTMNAWQHWEYNWQTPSERCRLTLMARATDSRGRTQPASRDLNRGTYMINHILPIEVEVR